MKLRFYMAMAAAWVVAIGLLAAEEPKGPGLTAEEFEAKLGYQTGTINLPGGMVTIKLPESFRFLGQEGSRRLLTDGWGNPPEIAQDVLGMLVPTQVSPLAEEGWAIVITYDEDGYVKDDDAASVDYTKVLKEMQEATQAANAERKKKGYDAVTLVGWAEPPSYNRETHKMYWAKELAFSDKPDHVLNYDIRILGRRGVLVLDAVAGMDQLPMIRQQTQDVLAAFEFNEGHRYTDYLPGKDKAAAYGIGGLIVGAAAAKAGLFKLLWVGILAFKKFLIAGVIALGAMLKRIFGKKKESQAPDPITPS